MFFFKSNSTAKAGLKEEIAENNGIIVDVRSAGERADGMIKGALGADWFNGELVNKANQWDPNKHYYLYCRSGNRSGAATDFLRSKGFKHVTNIGAYGSIAGML